MGLFSGCVGGAQPGSERAIARAEGYMVDMDFSPDWTAVVVGTSHEGAQVWSVADDKPLYKLEAGNARSVAFSPDGNLLALSWRSSDDRRGAVEVRQAADGELVRSFPDHGTTYSVAFSPDGKLLAAGGSRDVWLYDLASGEPRWSLDVPGWLVRFSPDGKHLLVSTDRIALYNVDDGALSQEVGGWSEGAFSPDGRLFASPAAQAGLAVQLWDTATWQATSRLDKAADAQPPPQVHNLAFSPDGKRLVVSTNSGTADLWDLGTGNSLRTFQFAQTLDGGKAAFSPDGKRLAIQNAYDIRIWDLDE
ncbi:MAG TPA: WD40 repeat domain-containing protein [Chloroflexia bacterium]|nr:WD40 repeat domain-containing protein [Chloroflexia bacterium]